jgi:hypothetical protein
MTSDIVHVHGLRNLISLAHECARVIMVQCECRYGCIVLVKNRTEQNMQCPVASGLSVSAWLCRCMCETKQRLN